MTTRDQIIEAYCLMASKLRYRPAAPSDGLGHITMPIAELDLRAEAEQYANDWIDQEDTGAFYIGCCDFPTRFATILAVEAARAMCGGNDALARDLLLGASDALDRATTPERTAKQRDFFGGGVR